MIQGGLCPGGCGFYLDENHGTVLCAANYDWFWEGRGHRCPIGEVCGDCESAYEIGVAEGYYP